MISLPVAFFLVGMVLLILAMRGRRIDDHLVCRRCRFDLIGLSREGPSPRCPECGSDLSRPRALRTGNRRRSRRMLGGVIALLALSLIIGGAMIADSTGKRRWNSFKPVWLLQLESRGGAAAGAVAAASELTARFGDGKLSPDAMRALAARALAVQADGKASWDPAWGSVLDAAWAADLLSDEQKTAYARHAVTYVFGMRDRTRQGDSWTMQSGFVFSRGGGRASFRVGAHLKSLTLDGQPVPPPKSEESGTVIGAGSAMWNTLSLPLSGEPGKRKLRAVWSITSAPAGQPAATATWEETVERDIEITPPDVPVIRLVPDEAVQPDMLKSCSVQRLTVNASRVAPHWASASITFRDPPRDVAFEVFWRDGSGHEWSLGLIAMPRAVPGRSTQRGFGVGAAVSGFQGGPVDVILRPSIPAALATTDVTDVWEGQIVVPAQPVKVNGELNPSP